jgi:serine/threonine protein kinase
MEQPWSDLDLIYEKELGAGSFGKVFQVFSKKSKERYALKQISIESYMHKKLNCDKPIIDTLCREIQILRKLNCDYVVKYLESWFEGPDKDHLDRLNFPIISDVSSTFTIQMLNFLYIKMELCDTTLSHWLDKKRNDGRSYEDEGSLLKNVFTQIFQG